MKQKPPQHLSTEARAWWSALSDEYTLTGDPAAELLLMAAMESFDRMRSAQVAIKKDGATVQGRDDQIKPHPLLTVERDSRAAMLAALKALNLDVDPTRANIGRPPGGR